MLSDLKPGMIFVPSSIQLSEAKRQLPNKPEHNQFGKAVELAIIEFLKNAGVALIVPEEEYATHDFDIGDVWYDVKCASQKAFTHTVSNREKIDWDRRKAFGKETIILSVKRIDEHSAKYLGEVNFNSIYSMPGKFDSTWWFKHG